MHRLLAFLAVRDGRHDEVLEQLTREAARCAEASGEVEATVLLAEKEDPLAALLQHMRPYQAVLELRTSVSDAATLLTPMLSDLATRLGDGIHADLSGAVFAEENQVAPARTRGQRYIALMRRKAGTSHEDYVAYYRNEHARFGRECPGTTGYHQNYVDGAVSRNAANACGFGIWDVDSVTELFFRSVREFDEGTAQTSIRQESALDEARFVDGPSMVGFCVAVAARFPA